MYEYGMPFEDKIGRSCQSLSHISCFIPNESLVQRKGTRMQFCQEISLEAQCSVYRNRIGSICLKVRCVEAKRSEYNMFQIGQTHAVLI